MEMIPKTNIETSKGIISTNTIHTRIALTEDDAVPPLWHLRVLRHQACVDIGLLAHRTPRLDPDLLAEVQERVRERRRDGREREPVGEREGRGQEQRAVRLVLRDVESGIVGEDHGDVVCLAEAIERAARRHPIPDA